MPAAVPKLVTYRAEKHATGFLKGRMAAANAAGRSSAQSFALLSGVYAAASCYSLRIRQKQDGAWPNLAKDVQCSESFDFVDVEHTMEQPVSGA